MWFVWKFFNTTKLAGIVYWVFFKDFASKISSSTFVRGTIAPQNPQRGRMDFNSVVHDMRGSKKKFPLVCVFPVCCVRYVCVSCVLCVWYLCVSCVLCVWYVCVSCVLCAVRVFCVYTNLIFFFFPFFFPSKQKNFPSQ